MNSGNIRIGLVYLGRKGGGATYSLEMAKALIEKGVKIFAILANEIENRDKWEKLFDNDNKIEFLPTYSSKFGFLKSFFPNRLYNKCVKRLEAWSPDLLYVPMLTLNARKITDRFKDFEIVTTIHDLHPHPGERNLVQYLIFEHVKKKSTKYIILTPSFKNTVCEMYKVSPERVCIIPHAGFSFNQYPPVFNKIHWTILFVGRITPYKGLEILLRAMEILKQEFPQLKLVIAGKGEISETENGLIQQNQDCIRLINSWLSEMEIAKLFENSDMTILPYTEASQSGVAAASFAAGRMIIASDIGGLKEQVEAGGGIVIETGNPVALAKAVAKCYRNTAIINEKNHHAYDYFKSELTWTESANKFIEFVSDINI